MKNAVSVIVKLWVVLTIFFSVFVFISSFGQIADEPTRNVILSLLIFQFVSWGTLLNRA